MEEDKVSRQIVVQPAGRGPRCIYTNILNTQHADLGLATSDTQLF